MAKCTSKHSNPGFSAALRYEVRQLSYLIYDVHAKTAPKCLLDKFAKINTKHHYNTRLSAKECFSVKFSRTEKMKKSFTN